MHPFRTVILTLIVTLIASCLGGIAFIYSGLFNVSARWQDPPLVKWVLITTRERSLDARRGNVKVPDNLDDPSSDHGRFQTLQEDVCDLPPRAWACPL